MQTIIWNITPGSAPAYIKRCSRCACERFESSGNFRVNANGSHIDVWLIYRCAKCGATWNIDILTRERAKSIPNELYRAFTDNDAETALKYSLRSDTLSRNNAVPDFGKVEFEIEGEVPRGTKEDTVLIRMISEPPAIVAAARLIAQKLGLSRSALKRLIERGGIWSNMDLRKVKLNREAVFGLREDWEVLLRGKQNYE